MKERDATGGQDVHPTCCCWPRTRPATRTCSRSPPLPRWKAFTIIPRIDKEFLARHAEGLICTSGCMSAEVPRLIEQGQVDAARRTLDWYYEVFGKDNFFLELQQHDIPELETHQPQPAGTGPALRCPLRCHQRCPLHRTRGCPPAGYPAGHPDRRPAHRPRPDAHDRTHPTTCAPRRRWRASSPKCPKRSRNTLLIAERCNVDLSVKDYRLPQFEVPEGTPPRPTCATCARRGPSSATGNAPTANEVQTRLDYELGVIHKMGFDAYFLIVWDLCRYAREHDIWYNARGSAAGSIVAYTLRHHPGRPAPARPALRAFPEPRAHLDARY